MLRPLRAGRTRLGWLAWLSGWLVWPSGSRQRGIQGLKRIGHRQGNGITGTGELRSDPRARFPEPTGCPAHGAPGAFRRFPGLARRGLGRHRAPYVLRLGAVCAERAAHLAADLAAQVLGA
jgi:hypothetical protein